MKKRRTLRVIVAALVATAAFMAAPLTSMAAPAADLAAANLITYQEAVNIAQAKYPKAKLVNLELDIEKKQYVYDMEFVNPDRKEYDVKVNAQTGKIVRNKYDGKLHSTLKLDQIKVSYDKAIATAQTKAVGGTFEKLEIDWQNKMPVYEIEFRMTNGREQKVEVDAATGQINQKEPQNIISEAEAKAIAIKAAGGGDVIRIKLDIDHDDNEATYDVKVRTSNRWICEVEIDAYTGNILDIDWDD